MSEEAAASLLQANEPVSYYDVVALLRPLRAADPSEPLLARLVQLYDAEHLTDGAREVLAGYLKALASRHDAERQLAARPIPYKASGRTVRAAAGSRLILRLPKKHDRTWQLSSILGPLSLSELASARAHEQTVDFELLLSAPGRGKIELVLSAAATEEALPFTLSVVVETRA